MPWEGKDPVLFTGGLSSDPHPSCSPGSPFGLEAFIQSGHTYSDLSPSISVTPLPLLSEGISDLAEGGVGPHAGRHLPRAHAGADSDEVHLHQSVRVSQDPCGSGKVAHLTVDVSTALSLHGCGLPMGTVPSTVCGCPECSPPLCVWVTQLFPLFGYCEFNSPFSVWVLWI